MGCVGGWGVDAFDVQLYNFVIPALIAVWGISRGEAGEIATAALLSSALVGSLSAQLGLGLSIGIFAGVAYATMATAALLLPETRGKILDP